MGDAVTFDIYFLNNLFFIVNCWDLICTTFIIIKIQLRYKKLI